MISIDLSPWLSLLLLYTVCEMKYVLEMTDLEILYIEAQRDACFGLIGLYLALDTLQLDLQGWGVYGSLGEQQIVRIRSLVLFAFS